MFSALGGRNEGAESLIYQPLQKQESEDAKILRYERVIDQLKKMVDNVKKQNKNTRQVFEREIASKTELEHHLKKVVDKVVKERKKNQERANRQSATKFYITALDSTPKLSGPVQDDHELSQEERERIIELLLGKDKVISLLYDREITGARPEEAHGGEDIMQYPAQAPEMHQNDYYQSAEQQQMMAEAAQL